MLENRFELKLISEFWRPKIKAATAYLLQNVDELGLDGGRVDAHVVEERLDLLGDLHVVVNVPTPDVGGGDYAVAGQLPDMKFVDGQDAVDL